MKWIKLYEEFKIKNNLILLDGVSSSGKTKTTERLSATPFLKSTKRTKKIVIGSDDFSNFENRIPYDHEGKGYDEKAGEKWHEMMPELRKNDDYELQKRGMTTVGWTKHPHHKELDGDPRVWYMAQAANEYKDKTIFFDDIGKSILHYLPNTLHILLHATLPILLENVVERGKKGKREERNPQMVLEQYLEKYRAQKKKPDESEGDPNLVLNKKYLKELLEKYKIDKKFIPKFIKELGIDDNDDYYVKVKRGYLGKGAHFITIDEKREKYIEKIKEILDYP